MQETKGVTPDLGNDTIARLFRRVVQFLQQPLALRFGQYLNEKKYLDSTFF